ncbi:histidine kinase [Massilia sp. P8910]|uniref:sensor histidine kinase n=1 Tax=Massilia antarctica TaxID=2765360 RepID=UPI001E459E34|nr:histidine kinase [Massilia antarctica]MCE3605780.1 histidine kinase [Massilia antarctica]
MNAPPPSLPSRNPALPTMRQSLVVTFVTLQLTWVLATLSSGPFLSVLLRIGFIAIALLFTYTATGALRQRALPSPLARVLAVALMAPLATLAIFRLTENSPAKRELVYGYIMLAVVALVVGLPVTLVALRLERKARERTARLQDERERHTLERELLDSRLRLLQAQIEPHFLFNTLANIAALVEAKSDNAGPVLRHLIAYLKAAMPRLADADATLDTELQLVRAYLELMHMRMPDRLHFTVDTPAALNGLPFPAMALLTLVENAVRHGIDPSLDGGCIEVGGKLDTASGRVSLWVSDTGMGMSELSQPGTGLNNVRTRLQAFYGDGAKLDLHEQAPHGLHVELTFHPRSTA